MKHSKPSPHYNSDFAVFHPTGILELSAERQTETGKRYIKVYVSLDTAREIQQTLNFADEHNQPLGHSYWHIHNKREYPCSSCN